MAKMIRFTKLSVELYKSYRVSALLRSSVGGLLASEAETRVAAIVCTTLCHMKRAIVSQGVPKKQPQLYLTHTPCICHRRAKDSSRISLPRSTPYC